MDLRELVVGDDALHALVGVLREDAALREREKGLTAPMTSMGAKVDQMANEFQFLRTTIEEELEKEV